MRPSASDIVFMAFGSETTSREKNNVYTYCHTIVSFAQTSHCISSNIMKNTKVCCLKILLKKLPRGAASKYLIINIWKVRKLKTVKNRKASPLRSDSSFFHILVQRSGVKVDNMHLKQISGCPTCFAAVRSV